MLTFTTARKLTDGSYVFVLEDSAVGYSRAFEWSGRDPDEYDTDADYEAMMTREATLLALSDLAAAAAPVDEQTLAIEGQPATAE